MLRVVLGHCPCSEEGGSLEESKRGLLVPCNVLEAHVAFSHVIEREIEGGREEEVREEVREVEAEGEGELAVHNGHAVAQLAPVVALNIDVALEVPEGDLCDEGGLGGLVVLQLHVADGNVGRNACNDVAQAARGNSGSVLSHSNEISADRGDGVRGTNLKNDEGIFASALVPHCQVEQSVGVRHVRSQAHAAGAESESANVAPGAEGAEADVGEVGAVVVGSDEPEAVSLLVRVDEGIDSADSGRCGDVQEHVPKAVVPKRREGDLALRGDVKHSEVRGRGLACLQRSARHR
mmetsp:Transcript_4664/g.16417  ORF Transcript_4664/g.16417 Transcript_4664/m.16417 type:complete len:293 (-) Transcript_4664:6-884(-)